MNLNRTRVDELRTRWRYLELAQQVLLEDTLPRIDLQTDQIRNIVERPQQVSLFVKQDEIGDNPFPTSEQYVGTSPA